MNALRITEFHARSEESARRVAELLEVGALVLRDNTACVSCRVLQHQEDPTRLVLLEEWVDIKRRIESVPSVPPEAVAEVIRRIAEEPLTSVYQPAWPNPSERALGRHG